MKEILENNQTKSIKDSYANTLQDYGTSKNKFAKSTTNPIYNVVSEFSNDKEAKTRKKWERAAVFTGLNTVFQGGSAIASAISGIKPQKIDNSAFNYSINQINASDKRALDNYNRIYKASLDNAIQQQKRTHEVQDKYLSSMNELRKEEAKKEEASRKAAEKEAARGAKLLNDSLKETRTNRSTASTKKTTTTVKERNPEMYVYNSSGKKVPLHKEDMTKLHQIGKLNNLDLEYKKAKSNQEREKEYDIMIQRSYLIYDKNRKDQVKSVK